MQEQEQQETGGGGPIRNLSCCWSPIDYHLLIIDPQPFLHLFHKPPQPVNSVCIRNGSDRKFAPLQGHKIWTQKLRILWYDTCKRRNLTHPNLRVQIARGGLFQHLNWVLCLDFPRNIKAIRVKSSIRVLEISAPGVHSCFSSWKKLSKLPCCRIKAKR